MRLSKSLYLLLLAFFSVSQAVVHTITTANHKVYPGSPKYSYYHKRHQAQLKKRIGLKNYHSRSRGSFETKNYYFYALGNISVGTPPQTFIVDIDFFWLRDFILIDSSANLTSVAEDIPDKNTFNSSDSSTFTDQNLNFSSSHGNAHIANDILALGDTFKSKVDFGLIDIIDYSLSNYYNFDGVLGLAPPIYDPVPSNFTSILNQLADVLDEPVITIWTNNNDNGIGCCVGTLGAVDSEHCQPNWVYVPQVSIGYDPYGFHVSSVEMTVSGKTQKLGLDMTLLLVNYNIELYLPESLRPWIVNATNAVYDSDGDYYEVDCDISKAAKLVFNIGGEGNTTSSANKQLVISAADYVMYSNSFNSCYLIVHFAAQTDVIEMNINFLDNHCLAYNIKDKTIGIADSKTAITDVKQFD